jgi:hypothetical protein
LNAVSSTINWAIVSSGLEATPAASGHTIKTLAGNQIKNFDDTKSTGIPNDGTVYNFRVQAATGTSNSTLYDISLVGSNIQTFDSLIAQLQAATTNPVGLSASVHWGYMALGDMGTIRVAGDVAVSALPSASAFTGVDHLIGASVDIVADGAAHPRRVVSSGGRISLQAPASTVRVGVPFTPELELLHPEPFQGDSTRVQQFQPRYINFLVQDTIGTDIIFQDKDGNEKRTETIPARSFGDLMDTPVPPLTDTVRVAATGWETPFNLIIRQNVPMPITMLSVIMEFQIDDN